MKHRRGRGGGRGRRRVVSAPSFHQRLSQPAAPSSEFASKCKVSTVPGVGEAAGAVEVIGEIEKRAVVDVVEVVVVDWVVLVAGVSGPVQIRQGFDVVLAIGRITV